jgi:hypothetical protein
MGVDWVGEGLDSVNPVRSAKNESIREVRCCCMLP